MAVVLGLLVLVAIAIWTAHAMSDETTDGRQQIVFWDGDQLGPDIYAIVNQFESLPENRDPRTGKPKYKVMMGSAVTPDPVGDAQRLLCAVAGKVPPDVVRFDRFAIGEWAGRGALENLKPFLNKQSPNDPSRIELQDYYQWALNETSYRQPGTQGDFGIYGIPIDVDMRLLFTNADLLRQEGLVNPKTGQPQPPRTWEELRRYSSLLTRYNIPGDKNSGIKRLGFSPSNNTGNSWLYMYSWEAGGQMLSDDRRHVTMDSPQNVRALHYMADLYDDIGGFAQVDAFAQTLQAGALDPFLMGSLGMKIDGIWSMEIIADWKRNMDFIISPPPIPADRLAAGYSPITWGGGYALVMPSTARNKEGAWKLIQYLSSKAIMEQLEMGRREDKEASGKLYLPKSMANHVVFDDLVKKYVDNNPTLPAPFRNAYKVVQEMMPHTLYRPVSPAGQLLWNQHVAATDMGVHHAFAEQAKTDMAAKVAAGKATPNDVENYELHLALSTAAKPVQEYLDELLKPLTKETQVRWAPWFWVYGIIVATPFVLMVWIYRAKRHRHIYKAKEIWAAMLFASPWIIGFVVFVGGPIFFSMLYTFMRYDVLSPAHWVGMENFVKLVHDPYVYKSMWNTAFMVIRVPLAMAVSLAISLLLNRSIRGLGFYRTACYMPAIMPVVAASWLWMWIFNPDQGILNQVLLSIYHLPPMEWVQHLLHVQFSAPLWLQSESWAKPAIVIMGIWGSGAGIIIWLAGLQSIPDQLYEAASIDGANSFGQFWNITIPMLSPYILFNFIIGVIGTMQIFNEAFVMTQGGPNNATLFYAYDLFRQGFQYFRMGYASALAWILFVVVLALTLLQLWLSTKWVHYERT
ncbi:MAG TPA: extracellular solute-binding protein [Tepidisphaeraceae bacterium]|jgi:multiple sugar transport system permease protein